jgi:signal transduction histidine kinase
LRDAQMELARANRVTATGQLAASIAHEVSQPIAAALTNANAAARSLGAEPPDLEEVRRPPWPDHQGRQTSQRGNRPDSRARQEGAAEERPAEHQRGDARSHRADAQRTALKRDVAADTAADGLPLILGDRTQLNLAEPADQNRAGWSG